MKDLLPTGIHSDIHMEHSLVRTGSYAGGGWKGIIHITVSPWRAIDSMVRVLHQKGAESHTVIGGRTGTKLPVGVQLVRLDEYGRALQHPAGTPETNRARCVQMEICATVGNAQRDKFGDDERDRFAGFDLPDVELPAELIRHANRVLELEDPGTLLEDIELCIREDDELLERFNSGVAAFTDQTYHALANYWKWHVARPHRAPVPVKVARGSRDPRRFGASEFVGVSGFCGHMHVPNNTHVDPTSGFNIGKLVRMLDKSFELGTHHYYQL